MALNSAAADEMQTILTVAEHLRSNLYNETERVKQVQKQYDELLNRYEDTLRQGATDKHKIREQKDEIGNSISIYAGHCYAIKWISEQAWRERDAALLRDQISQAQMNTMRTKLETIQSEVKNVSQNTRDE